LLHAIIHEGDAEAVVKEKQEKALAEHVARHPEDVGRTVEDFKWIVHVIVAWPRKPDARCRVWEAAPRSTLALGHDRRKSPMSS
jgi:hypothetical protein